MSGPTAPLPFFLGKRLEDLTTLSKSRLLRALDVKEISFFFDALDQMTLPKGFDLVSDHVTEDGPRHLGFILEGSARVKRGELDLGRIGLGDHYGERVLLRQSPGIFQVIAESDVRIARLTLGRFESLAHQHPRVALDLVRAIAATATDDLTVLADRLRALVRERSVPRPLDLLVRFGTESRRVGTGTTITELFPSAPSPRDMLAVKLDGRPVMLDTKLAADAVLEAIMVGTEGGDEILARSVGLSMLDVLHEVRPDAYARVLAPIEGAIVVEVRGDGDRANLLSDVSQAVSRRSTQPLAFAEELWTLEEARAFFAEHGFDEAAKLLENRPASTVTLARCGESFALSLGPCVPMTSDMGPLGIASHPRGLLVDIGRARRGHAPEDSLEREQRTPRYGGLMADEHRHWLSRFGADSVGALAGLATSGRLVDLVLAGEAFHEKALGRIADEIARRAAAGLRVIRVAGPSSSGKTTFIRRLTVALSLVGMRTVGLSLDDFYVDREKTIRDENGELDFEAPEAIDSGLFRAQLERLVAGEKLKTARYDFLTGKSLPEGGPELALSPHDLLLVEGLHALEPSMVPGGFSKESVGIFVHPATTLPVDRLTTLAPTDLRLLRRIVRDRHTRGYHASETIARWPSVRRGEERHVFARLPTADFVFDTALAYEPCVLKLLAERCLLEVRRTDPGFVEACRLRELLEGFVGLEAGHVPSSSILREFIGHGPR